MNFRPALIAVALCCTPAMSQTIDQVREDANGIIAALRQQRDAANDGLAQAMAQIAKLQKQVEAAKKPASAPEQKDVAK